MLIKADLGSCRIQLESVRIGLYYACKLQIATRLVACNDTGAKRSIVIGYNRLLRSAAFVIHLPSTNNDLLSKITRL